MSGRTEIYNSKTLRQQRKARKKGRRYHVESLSERARNSYHRFKITAILAALMKQFFISCDVVVVDTWQKP